MPFGHPGRDKTLELVQRDYYWPNQYETVKEYVRTCTECQRNKGKKHKPYGELKQLVVAKRPWSEISMDFVEQLPRCGEYENILVIVDRFTKEARFIPTRRTMTARELAETLLSVVFSKKGFPDAITSDRGSLFVSAFLKEMWRLMKVERRVSTPYHPQTDGQTERVNQSLEGYLRTYCGWDQDDWVGLLPMAEFTYNNSVHSATRTTPFFANHGYHPRFDVEGELFSTESPTAGVMVKDFDKMWRETQYWIAVANQRTASYDEGRKSQEPLIKVGDRVLLDSEVVKRYRPTKKLAARWLGPYRVKEKVADLAYRIELPKSWKRHDVFHVCQLEPFWEAAETYRKAPDSTEEIPDDGQDFELERILDSRQRKGKGIEYKVQWRGYTGPDAVEWIREEDIEAEELIEDFHILNPGAPKRAERPVFAVDREDMQRTEIRK